MKNKTIMIVEPFFTRELGKLLLVVSNFAMGFQTEYSSQEWCSSKHSPIVQEVQPIKNGNALAN